MMTLLESYRNVCTVIKACRYDFYKVANGALQGAHAGATVAGVSMGLCGGLFFHAKYHERVKTLLQQHPSCMQFANTVICLDVNSPAITSHNELKSINMMEIWQMICLGVLFGMIWGAVAGAVNGSKQVLMEQEIVLPRRE